MAANAARRASFTPLQRRLSPACNSDCTRIWASSKVMVPLLCPVQGFLANRPHSMIELSRPILASSSRTKVVVDLSIEPPGRQILTAPRQSRLGTSVTMPAALGPDYCREVTLPHVRDRHPGVTWILHQ